MKTHCLMVFLAVAALWGCSGRNAFEKARIGSGSLQDSHRYAAGRLEAFRTIPLVHYGVAFLDDVLTGDVTAGPEAEIVAVSGKTVRVYRADGNVLSEFPGGEWPLGLGFLEDVDGDGKCDIVCGGREDQGVRIVAFNGKGDRIWEAEFEEMVMGNTYPLFLQDGRIHFIAHSAYNMAPKIVGSMDLAKRAPQWTFYMGPLPVEESLGSDGSHLLVSGRALTSEGRKAAVPYRSDRLRNTVSLVDAATGIETGSWTFGPPAAEQVPAEGEISAARGKLFDVDGDGKDEMLVLEEHISELFTGPSAFQVLDGNGRTLAQLTGPGHTAANFGFYHRGGDGRVILVWKETGQVLILDKRLQILQQAVLPGTVHEAVLQGIGDYDGDGSPECIVSDGRRLHVLNDKLETVYESAFSAGIRRILSFPGKSKAASFAVLADSLYLLVPGNASCGTIEAVAHPPGSNVFLDGKSVDHADLPAIFNVTPGKHVVETEIDGYRSGPIEVTVTAGKIARTEATVQIPGTPKIRTAGGPTVLRTPILPSTPLRDYAAFHPVRSMIVPAGALFCGIDDFVAGPGLDLFFIDPAASSYFIADETLKERVRRQYRAGYGVRISFPGDVDGDGKADIAVGNGPDPVRLSVFAADGRTVFSKDLAYGFDNTSVMEVIRAGTELLAIVNTGYLLRPRGFYRLDPVHNVLKHYFPMAAGPGGLVWDGKRVILSLYTVSNGADLKREDGTVEIDTSFMVNIVGDRGQRLPGSQPISAENNAGALRAILWDNSGTGALGTYFLENHDAEYYSGKGRLWRLEEDNSLRIVYTGPENDNAACWAFTGKQGEPRLVIHFIRAGTVVVLDGNHAVVSRAQIEKNASIAGFLDLDADGSPELALVMDRGVEFYDILGRFKGRVEATGKIYAAQFADLDGNGTTEMVVVGPDTAVVYGY